MMMDFAGKSLDLSASHVMGIVNVTPDSFSDGGRFFSPAKALEQARKLIADGATIIDIGGESTRPGSDPVDVEEEIRRVVPAIEAIHAEFDVVISIDTMKADVMRAAVKAGASLINDVNALQGDGALQAAAELDVPVCLMHMQGTPQTMQQQPHYVDVVNEVNNFLSERVAACEAAGISRSRIILDPGFGFGKNARHNLRLMKHLSVITESDLPVLVGVSRKSIIGAMLNVSVEERLAGSLALASIAIWQGAKIIRSHDVRETVQAVRLCEHVMQVNDFD
ncbi:dihydropteroate synthase [Methylophaga sp. UBA2689]|jgi:dihydropteroate synthase|uniref:dihydropteroate synthase n=1 Tax=Methylophaga sp. UBA2689 TaxID=1946878 RepID=UPI0025D0BDB0|nr:dihydropteroate synthase [Methylophaga sp. UBA2689]|tara:strand:- start:1424 stop:2263 length:840 start_codon:yes stop_codon:yes gene_type:complete